MILVAGIGNIFFGDDAFGSEVARRMAPRFMSGDVRVVDFNIRGLDLAFALMDEYDRIVIVDATRRGGAPGTIYVIEPDLHELDSLIPAVEAHSLDPMRVLALSRSMGAQLKNVRIVGCEPAALGADDEGCMGLSPAVAVAVDKAIEVIESLIQEALV
jgi:hydrogenase maturation protease